MSAPLYKKKRKKNHRSVVWRYWWLPLVVAGVGMMLWVATGPRWSRAKVSLPLGNRPISGYSSSTATVLQEFLHFYGKPLDNAEIERLCNQANERVAAKDYSNAVGMLEQVVKVAGVPAVYNNLGVLYAEVNDRPRSINAFREALARDVDYQPVRLNLERLKEIVALGADPVTREVESNNNPGLANIIAVGRPVEGAIAASMDDVDFFRVTTPPAPRDLILIEIENHSTTLAPVLKVFDADERLTGMGKTGAAGESVKLTISPSPNTAYFLQVSGYGGSAGAYTLRVLAQKAFDAYEPNDDIFNARRLTLGTPVEAGIMDDTDTDFFSFVSPRSGTVSIVINNRSTTLIPALSTFFPDMRSSGFGPDVQTPGGTLRHTLEVQENQTYFLQVWSRSSTAGKYSLLVE
uniref:Tetratricopeptide TPR_2 repeat protein n=1 Tax=Solibacter usitatus (strain Ellin6076) TaxID=234267 RepID=Q02CB2_SOLUE